MAKYIDVVAVRFSDTDRLRVYKAPWYSGMVKGTKVLCETADGEQLGTVEGVIVSANSEEAEFAKLLNEGELKRIIAQFKRVDMEYDDDAEV